MLVRPRPPRPAGARALGLACAALLLVSTAPAVPALAAPTVEAHVPVAAPPSALRPAPPCAQVDPLQPPPVCTVVDVAPTAGRDADPQTGVAPSSVAATGAPEVSWWPSPDEEHWPRPDWPAACTGTGADGKRLRLFHYRASDQPALDEAGRAELRRIAEEVDRTFFLSAEARGEGRRLRWLTTPPTDGGCDVVVREVVGEPGTTYGRPGFLEAAGAAGVSRDEDSLDVVFIDGTAGSLHGYAEMALDDSAGPGNENALGGRHAGLYRAGWDQFTVAHEVAHLLGAVQASAPHADGSGHCSDGHDVLCYAGGASQDAACALPPRRSAGYVDCRGDDYYHPAAAAGSYLGTHWNVASSPFLDRVPAAGGAPSSRIVIGHGQVVLPHTRVSYTAADDTPAGAFLDPDVRRWATSSGCLVTHGTPTEGELFCLRSGTGSYPVTVGHLAVDQLDRDAVATAALTVEEPPQTLPASLAIEVDRSSVVAGEQVRVTATYLGQAPGQTAPATPLVGVRVQVRQDGAVEGEPALEQRDASTDPTGSASWTFRMLESSSFTVYAEVTGVWAAGQAVATVQVDPGAAPAAPRRVSAAPADGGAVVSWQDPLGGTAGGTDRWEVVEDGAVVGTAPAEARSLAVSGLANGQESLLAVRSVVDGVDGLLSNPASVTPVGPPSAPRSVVGWDHHRRVDASWLPPLRDGGGGALTYQVSLDPVGTVVETGDEVVEFEGLEDGRAHTVRVRARNERSDWGPWSEPSAAVVPASPPPAPTDVQASPADSSAVISWRPPPGDGGAPIEGYFVVNLVTGGAITADAGAGSAVYPALDNGQVYRFAVHAYNRAGGGAASAPSNEVTPVAAAGPPPPPTGGACPQDRVPPAGFTDVPAGSTHAAAVDCLLWWQVTKGRTPTTFAPQEQVRRDAMASFIARTVVSAGGTLPSFPPDAFTDDGASVHRTAIDQLAAVGLVQGTGGGTYSPERTVTRGQMARFLAGAAAYVLGAPLPPGPDAFPDDAGSLFEADINRVAAAGLATGRPDGTYQPGESVTRAQMASFLTRLLDLYVERGAAFPPG